jgi:hypothetical protein
VSSTDLSTYLNDHLAGSVVALELLDHLLTLPSGVNHQDLINVRTEIEEDQDVLRRLLHELGAKESRVRKAAAWLTEKLAQAKLRFDDAGEGDLQVLEALEALALGIQGKLALWRALASVGGTVPQLQKLDFKRLQQRAISQFERVDAARLRSARGALAR